VPKVGLIAKEELGEDFSLEHLNQFVSLWCLLQEVFLDEEMDDQITWKLTENGQYLANLTYDLQFLGSTYLSMYKSVWKAWAPPKYKSFAWTALQNRIWMAEHFKKRGGKIVGLAFYASNLLNRCTISSSIASTPYVFGTKRNKLVSPKLT
jgi:hypothetical protein